MSKVSPESLILIGKVIRPHGTQGLLKICSYAQSPETFTCSVTAQLESDDGAFAEFRVLSITPHKNSFLLKLEGVNTLEKADLYRGADIYIDKHHLGQGQEGEYFWFELVGIKVYASTGKYIGAIKQVFSTRSNDIYVVGEGKEEILIPATYDAIKEVDLENRRMIIGEMEGLLDLNED